MKAKTNRRSEQQKSTKAMLSDSSPTYRGWVYAEHGDYHREPHPNWPFALTYMHKMAFIKGLVHTLPLETRILDAGSGEGVLVEDLATDGYDIVGIDLNYEGKHVRRASVLDIPFADNSFDVVLLLDVFEHLAYAEQPPALAEIHRVVKPKGLFVASIPNLAHWNSRFRLVFFGQLDRTDVETNHVGERPYNENRRILKAAGFKIEKVKGVTLTVPVVYRKIICRRPAWFRWLHDLLAFFAIPSLCLVDIFVCRACPAHHENHLNTS